MSLEPEYEAARQRAYQRLGSDDPRCTLCPEDDWRCRELHHLAGVAYDEAGVIVCRNCHRRQSTPWANRKPPADPPLMVRAAHLLLGLISFMTAAMEAAHRTALGLLEGAQVCPWPYGWVGAPESAR